MLAAPGREGWEASALWIGLPANDSSTRIVAAWQPEQIAYKTLHGAAVEVTQEALTDLILALTPGHFVAVRLHTHPSEAYHSEVDDNNMIIGHAGAISIVVPNFASDPLELARCSVNELLPPGGWAELTTAEVAQRFRIV
jgi:hypothetical protein